MLNYMMMLLAGHNMGLAHAAIDPTNSNTVPDSATYLDWYGTVLLLIDEVCSVPCVLSYSCLITGRL